MKKLLAFAVGILIFVITCSTLSSIGNSLGIDSSVDLDGTVTISHGYGREGYDEEVSSFMTSYGYTSIGLGGLLALWFGRMVYFKSRTAGYTKKQSLTFKAWFAALSILLIFSAISRLAFKLFYGSASAGFIFSIIELASVVGVGWACHHWWLQRAALIAADDG